MSDDTLIQVDHVSKKFCRDLKTSLWYGVKDIGNEVLGRNGHHDQLRPGEFWAVDDVSFEVKRGECLGLIGRNGAGKSTLLKMLNGLIKPDKGKITMRGRVGALIELGTGFNPILTGRENIYNNAAVLGMGKREVDQKLDAIIDFAELPGDALDAPVQTYSSGMKVRLGFAVAAHMEPDVLLIDEVLAVGDIGFVIKCLNAIRRLAENTAVILVTHNTARLSFFCSRLVLLNQGQLVADSVELGAVIDRYLAYFDPPQGASGTGLAAVERLVFEDPRSHGLREAPICQGCDCTVLLDLVIDAKAGPCWLSVNVDDQAMAPIATFPVVDSAGCPIIYDPGRHSLRISLGPMELNASKYSFVVVVLDASDSFVVARVHGLLPFRVVAEKTYWGYVVRPAVLNGNGDASANGRGT